MKNTKIEWTDTTWNPVSGCTRASAGCDNCYAVTMTKRLEAMGQQKYSGLVNIGKNHFNGVVKCHEEALTLPLGWKKPQKIFVNSMSDLFHKDVPFGFIDKVFAVMALCPQHTFQILTKRPERMAEYFEGFDYDSDRIVESFSPEVQEIISDPCIFDRGFTLRQVALDEYASHFKAWPIPNVWLGVSVEDQATADERIPHLLRCPAAVRFLLCEPLLGPVEVDDTYQCCKRCGTRIPFDTENSDAWESHPEWTGGCPVCGVVHRGGTPIADTTMLSHIDWVICGGESGHNARPMHPDWARSLRDQCVKAGVPFFFKQWGEYHPRLMHGVWPDTRTGCCDNLPSVHIHEDGHVHRSGDRGTPTNMKRVGKKRAGRMLDGREWNEFPEVPR